MRLLLISLIIGNFLLAPTGTAAEETAGALNHAGMEHFSKGFYEATPRGNHAVAAQEFKLAEQLFREAIRGNPDWVEPYLHLGRTYFVQKAYPQAIEVYQKALAIAPQNKAIYTQLASALEMGGNFEGAADVLLALRAQETDAHAITRLDNLIERLQARARGDR